jgi:alpha-2-macroglobulin-like protein
VSGAKTSITCSFGESLTVEASSIAVLAWLQDDDFAANARSGMDWIVAQCKNGRFGSTQATVLALKAIIAYDVKTASPKAAGTVQLTVNGEVVDTVTFTPATEGALRFDTTKVLQCSTMQACSSRVLASRWESRWMLAVMRRLWRSCRLDPRPCLE